VTRRALWGQALVIALLALAASANSVTNGFAYDDNYIIQLSAARMSTLAGWWREFAATYWPSSGTGPGDGYRPLTILAFKLQWQLGGGSPLPFHAINIGLHVVTSVAAFWLARAVLPLAAAWIAAALYAVHPVHTEAIANVVGQSEIIVALLVSIAMGLYIHGRRAGTLGAGRWAAIATLYALGMFFKEHAITLIALLPLAELTVVPDRAPIRARLTRMRLPLLVMLLLAVGYLWARGLAIKGGSGFQPYIVFHSLDLSHADRILTMVRASPEWLRLLLWPARLQTEYAPPDIAIAQGPSVAQLPGLLILLGTLGIAAATWRRSPATSFGIAWLVITLLPASNFILPAGFIIAERTLLLPSIGAMLAVASAVPWIYQRIEARRALQLAAAGALGLVLALGVVRSVKRNPVWNDSETLMRQAIKDSPDSYRAHFMLGVVLFRRGNLADGERQFRQALRMFPYDPYMIWTLAERYRGSRLCYPAVELYEAFYQMMPANSTGLLGYAECLLALRRPDEARRVALRWIQLGGGLKVSRRIIADATRMRDSLRADGTPSANGPP